MKNYLRNISVSLIVVAIISSCGENNKSKNSDQSSTETTQSEKIDVQKEIETWKQELITNKTLGKPCDNNSDRDKMQKWASENPEQLDGFPSDKESIGIGKADFDSDGGQDIILFFNSENCTGHNGGTPSFAKIIYSNGHSEVIQDDILGAILDAYNKQKASDNELKDVTDNYLKSTTTIEFSDNQIQGKFSLYTNDDPHCCPSYIGEYTYDPQTKQAKIDVTKTTE